MNIRTHRIHGSMYIDLHKTIIFYNIVGINIPLIHGLLWDIFCGETPVTQLFPDMLCSTFCNGPPGRSPPSAFFSNIKIWMFPKIGEGSPKWMVKMKENLLKMDDLGV